MIFRPFFLSLIVCVSHTSLAKAGISIALNVDGSINVFNQGKAEWLPLSDKHKVWEGAIPRRELVDSQLLTDFNKSLFVNCNPVKHQNHNEILFKDVYLNKRGLLNLSNDKFGVLIDSEGRVVSKHCAASVLKTKFSPDGQLIVFITKDIERIDFINNKVALWAAKYSGTESIHLYDLKNNTHKVKSFESELSDVLIDDNGVVHLILSKGSTSVASPSKLINAISGHPNIKYEREYAQVDMFAGNTGLYGLPIGDSFKLIRIVYQ